MRPSILIMCSPFLLATACERPATAPNGDTGSPESSGATANKPPTVPLVGPTGMVLGSVSGGESDEGAVLRIEAHGLPPGTHGLHLHAVGRCEGPAFESAGPHLNPTGAKHGIDNPAGPHLGDLPNLTVEADGAAKATLTIRESNLARTGLPGGSPPILDADGAALVIHAKADDNRTDPSGNSGDRIACAAL